MASDVNAILVAQDGRLDMFEAIGWVKRVAPERQARALSPELFDAVFG
jgi:hypothetical protein